MRNLRPHPSRLITAVVVASVALSAGCQASRDDRTPGDVGERPEGTEVPVTPLDGTPPETTESTISGDSIPGRMETTPPRESIPG